MKIGVILLAAGSGSRFGGNLPKQYVPVCGKPIVLHALEYLAAEPRIAAVQPVVAEGDVQFSQLVAGMVFHFVHDALLFFVQVSDDQAFGFAENAAFYAALWIGVGIACMITRLAADRLGVRADAELYPAELDTGQDE